MKKGTKKFFALLLVMCMTISTAIALTSCGGSDGASEDETYTLKMHMSVNTNDHVYAGAEAFANYVSENTDGKVTVELYPSSQLGVTADCIEGLPVRTCDIVFDSLSNLSSITPIANIEAMPYMFNSVDHFNKVWQGEIGQKIFDDIEAASGIKIVGSALQGVRILTTTKRVEHPADIKGQKLRVPTIDVYLKTWETIGASPTPLSGAEIFTAVQQGTVIGQGNSYPSSAGLSMQDICKYVTETNHVYSMAAMMMDSGFFNSLPAEYQQVILDGAKVAAQKAEEEYETNAANSKQQFVDAGCEIIEVEADEWKATLDGFVENNYPDLVEYYQAIIDADK